MKRKQKGPEEGTASEYRGQILKKREVSILNEKYKACKQKQQSIATEGISTYGWCRSELDFALCLFNYFVFNFFGLFFLIPLGHQAYNCLLQKGIV